MSLVTWKKLHLDYRILLACSKGEKIYFDFDVSSEFYGNGALNLIFVARGWSWIVEYDAATNLVAPVQLVVKQFLTTELKLN